MPIGAGLEKLEAYLNQNKERHIERIQSVIRQPSVSTEDHGVRECAQVINEIHKDVGFHEAEIIQTGGLPGLWGYYDAGAPKTIVVYSNFDTRPVLPHEVWEHDPYSATLTSMGGFDRVLVGRGSYSYKGPYIAWLNALEALIAVEGTLPVNVITLIEGDEILGSPYYREMINKYRDRISKANASLSPGASQAPNGNVTMTMGYKGMIYAEMSAGGGRWDRGPQGGPTHGMTKSILDSPVWRLVHALSSLTEVNGNKVNVDGFYDQLVPVTDQERQEAMDYWKSMGSGAWNKLFPVGTAQHNVSDLSDEETILNFFYGPSFNINGIKGGFTGPGTLPFSLPHEASARFDIRIPRGYKAKPVVDGIRRHLDRMGYQDVEFNAMGAFDPSKQDESSDLVRSLHKAFATMEVPLITPPGSGGGGPWSIFTTEFGMPMIRSVGVGVGGGTGGPNEYMVIDGKGPAGGLVECELSHMHILKAYAEEN